MKNEIRDNQLRQKVCTAIREFSQKEKAKNLTMGEIAKVSGISVSTLYRLFGTKYGILFWLMDNNLYSEKTRTDFEAILAETDGMTLLRRFADFIISVYNRQLSILPDFIKDEAPVIIMRNRVNANKGIYQKKYADVIKRMREIGSLCDELADEDVLRILWYASDIWLYQQLVEEHAWYPEHYREWFLRLLKRSIMATKQ